MATLNPQFHFLRDSLEIIRENDGTSYVTDTTHWVDCGLAAPAGDGTRTEAQYQSMYLVIDFESFVSDDGGDGETLEISLLLTNTESGTAGEGDTGAADLVTHRLRYYKNADDDMAGRVVIPLHNYDVKAVSEVSNGGTNYRFLGVKFDFTGAGLAVKWGAFISKC